MMRSFFSAARSYHHSVFAGHDCSFTRRFARRYDLAGLADLAPIKGIRLNAESTIAPPAASELAFPDARRLRSRDVFRLVGRAWPFIRPYRRHLAYLFLLTLPMLLGGLVGLILMRVFFDVIGNGAALTPTQAWMLDVPLHADRRTVLIHACVLAGIAPVVALAVGGLLVGYGIWILQRISNLFRVNLYTRMQELSVRFHSEEKIGDAIFRMFQDSAAIPNVINGLIVQPLIFIPAAIGSILYLVWYDLRMAAIAALLIPANFILAWMYADSMRAAFIDEREATALATTRIEETLASIKTVKAFGTEALEAGNYARDNWHAFIAGRRARSMLARYRVMTNTVRGLAYAAALYVGAAEVMAGGTAGLSHAGGFARTVPGIAHAGGERQRTHAEYYEPVGQHAGRGGRDFARARDARTDARAKRQQRQRDPAGDSDRFDV